MAERTVRLKRNNKDCFYLVEDAELRNGNITFSILNDFYTYKASFTAYRRYGKQTVIDCTKLVLVSIVRKES
jgi:hypothetical protein